MREKLIRDKIPEQASARGEVMLVRVASEDELFDLLIAKMREELTELETASPESRLEELGDLIEAAMAMGHHLGARGVYGIGIEKYKKLGGFSKKFVLRLAEETEKS